MPLKRGKAEEAGNEEDGEGKVEDEEEENEEGKEEDGEGKLEDEEVDEEEEENARHDEKAACVLGRWARGT